MKHGTFTSPMKSWLGFCLVFLFRIFNSVSLVTFFDPDEYWQSLEVAHYTVYGYGFVTWEWQEGLRGFLHPSLFALFYQLLSLFSCDHPLLVAHGPRVIMAFFAAVCDFYLYLLAQRLFNSGVAKWTLFCQLSNWFIFYCLPRTYSNSLETTLIVVALYYWYQPDVRDASNRRLPLVLGALSFLVRPTAAVLWIFVGVTELIAIKKFSDKLRFIMFEVVPVGIISLLFSVGVDYIFYNRVVFVHYNFLMFNVFSGASAEYGTHPWYWYLTALPVMLGPHVIPFLGGLFFSKKNSSTSTLVSLITWYIAIFSLMGHKEFRFILPILPLSLILCGYFFNTHSSLFSASPEKDRTSRRRTGIILVCLLLLVSVGMMTFFGRFHQRGTLDAVEFLEADKSIQWVDFLMPCHSFPFYSHIHRPIKMTFLECPPTMMQVKGHRDTQQEFYDARERSKEDLYHYLEERYFHGFPSHILIFDELEPFLGTFFQSFGYVREAEFFHSFFADGKRSKNVQIYIKSH
eukprot:TRINITY_DN6643_c0_g1_i1.p1 TRINITY_DN6643_c0_g1~~TRINITY_DN6643_c0_g1_i1.p1  ORF type:complete len:516 (-),score=63.71 TRINITY_DN6643_c0_g1_i1:31-1578(-)